MICGLKLTVSKLAVIAFVVFITCVNQVGDGHWFWGTFRLTIMFSKNRIWHTFHGTREKAVRPLDKWDHVVLDEIK